MRSLVLLTESYPYKHSGERPFLDPELSCLRNEFDRIIIVPSQEQSGGLMIYSGVQAEEGLAKRLARSVSRSRILVYALTSLVFYQELFKRPGLMLDLSALKRLIIYIYRSRIIEHWLRQFIIDQKLELANTIFYSYWCSETATALGLAKKQLPELRAVARAHGYDLYEQRYQPAYIPCRSATLGGLDRLFLISENGAAHIKERFPGQAGSCQVARLGVVDPGFTARKSTDNTFRLVSCSNIIALKRLDLLIRGLNELAGQRPQQKLEWHHFGDGPEQISVKRAAKKLPRNIQAIFYGRVPNHHLIRFYRSGPVDAFINVSSSEGLPVSIMEALSCGIPVIAPDIGGISEIVNDSNGCLLSANAGPKEIAQALIDLIDDQQIDKKRIAALKVWQAKFDSNINHQVFSRSLTELCGRKT